MIETIQDKKEISRKLKERAIFEGFAIAGIASIPPLANILFILAISSSWSLQNLWFVFGRGILLLKLEIPDHWLHSKLEHDILQVRFAY